MNLFKIRNIFRDTALCIVLFFLACLPFSCLAGDSLINAFPNLKFDQPLLLTYCPDGTNRLFVVERGGKVLDFANNHNVKLFNVFLDISNKVETGGLEQGLLGLAFHPDFKKNGYFYVNYIAPNPDRTVISRFQANSKKPVNETEQVVLEIKQPYPNHNGGMLAFGPDGYLYIGTGDGGSAGDPHLNGQKTNVLLGKILRIDINKPEGFYKYSIPPDNPFYAKKNIRPEIWATGMRNPWRFSFDYVTGELWVADVGQNQYEEVNLVRKGGNYGWNIMEGFHCYYSADCNQNSLQLPVVEYNHTQGISITGGFVYRGKTMKKLIGSYIYADFGSGKIWALKHNNGKLITNSQLVDSDLNISSFGTDQNNELYMVDFNGGGIYKFR